MQRIAAVMTLVVAGSASALEAAAAGVDSESQRDSTRYVIAVLPSLGGGSSLGTSVNNLGWVAGRSNLQGNASRHATLWRNERLSDLGTLGGANSAVLWPVNRAGLSGDSGV